MQVFKFYQNNQMQQKLYKYILYIWEQKKSKCVTFNKSYMYLKSYILNCQSNIIIMRKFYRLLYFFQNANFEQNKNVYFKIFKCNRLKILISNQN